ncbi:M1 family metallopeptidase [Mucilaginibacter psychrotolerans]|uniref:Aminopeptidase N n=1 Tax=Mucilaginibacter psychrotolerans TaxID=1524096 RepID=A0A4Y8SMX5_9SPHI|nr:M1 family metallopeptidase [Mucilaginibacter psychrotolerans]TFF40399.1 M1 family peptidase [Mucilaginibacter psychrotolerans]
MLKLRQLFLLSFVVTYTLSAQAQQPGAPIDVLHYKFALQLNDANNNIKGQATVQVKFLKTVNAFSLDLVKKKTNGKGMLVSSVTEGGKALVFKQDSTSLVISTKVTTSSTHNYTIKYSGIPADGLIISTNNYKHRTFFGDNWPNRAQNWLPCADHPSDKATVEFIVTAPAHYGVVANGLKLKEQTLPGNFKLTHWRENAPISTKVMVIGVADFAIDHTGDVNGIPVYTYVFPEDKGTGFKSYAVAKEILPFFIKNVGPFSYEKLANVQSKTIFGGMENASCIFYFEESVKSPTIEELMAHEIAHQWFGDAASEKTWPNLWLSEGFATYMTNLYLESKYGTKQLEQRLLADKATVFALEKTHFAAVVDTTINGDYMKLLNANSYQKGGWVLHMLRRKLGDELFWKGIRNYYTQYKDKNANTDDLCAVMEQVGGVDLKPFFKQWLYTAGHPALTIEKTYDKASKTLTLHIIQKQDTVYEFPLEFTIDGKAGIIRVTEKEMTMKFTAESGDIVFDPNVNLLATIKIAD